MDKAAVMGKAASLGLDGERVWEAFQLLDREIEIGEIPGGVVSVSRGGSCLTYAAGDSYRYEDTVIAAETDTLYDCASLTKVVVTLPLILILLEQGRIRLDDPVAAFLPEFAGKGKGAVTIGHLLTHTGGLIPFADMHSHGWTPQQIADFVLNQELTHEPGTRVVYSDMGFILLGYLAARLLEMPLDSAARSFIFEPLGMNESGYRPAAELERRIAATEVHPNRSGPLWGEVHDENALAMGGVSGHAGLFSTAGDLSRYAAMWLREGELENRRILSKASVRAAVRSFTGHLPAGSRGLSWVLKGDAFDASGDLLSPRSYGHTGFTGTSLYVDPELELTVVLLTNRVHFNRDKSVARLRATFHNAIASAVR